MPSTALQLSAATEERLLAAAAVLRLSPEAFLGRLLAQHFNTLGGLPREVLRYLFTFLDYSTISGLVARVSRLWQDCVLESPQNLFSKLRQIHGIHLLDPVHGLFYFPRALKRVVFESKSGGAATSSVSPGLGGSSSHRSSSGAAAGLRGGAGLRHPSSAVPSVPSADVTAVATQPASSFLTVDIRTQNTKALPWGYVQVSVRRAMEEERMAYGTVRTPGLQRPEEPVWSQAATVNYDRRIYMFGGETYEGVVLDRAYEYDPLTKHWRVLPSLNERRAAAAAVAFRGRIFVFGGYNEEGEVLDTYEVLDVATRVWLSRQFPAPWLFGSNHAMPGPSTAFSRQQCQREQPQGSTAFSPAAATEMSAAAYHAGFAASALSYRMPEKVCGTATTVHGDVVLFAGGHRSCIAPDQTAVSYSALNSSSTTPMHSMSAAAGGGIGAHNASIGAGAGLTTASNLSVVETPLPRLSSSRSGNSLAGNAISHNPLFPGAPRTPVSERAGGEAAAHAQSTNNTINISGVGSGRHTDSPRRFPRVASISMDGPANAESFMWIFSPLTGQWWTGGPRLPSPRAFGALTVLDLPVLGYCLCYFGGCAKADAPETAMFYIPLHVAEHTKLPVRDPMREAAVAATAGVARTPEANGSVPAQEQARAGEEKVTQDVSCTSPEFDAENFLRSAMDPWAAKLHSPASRTPHSPQPQPPPPQRSSHLSRRVTESAPHTPTDLPSPLSTWKASATAADPSERSAVLVSPSLTDPVKSLRPSDSSPASSSLTSIDMVRRCFRDTEKLPWQRYVRIPIGGAFTSVVLLGAPQSRTVVLTGFYPAPNIGYCKVNHLLPPDAFLPLLRALSPPSLGKPTTASASLPPPPILSLDAALQDEAMAAANHFHQEREWSHHQRQEVREMLRSVASAATLRHPRNPQTAGEEHKWNLAPVPEVRVRNPTGPALTRVSWKVQSLNAKVIVGIE